MNTESIWDAAIPANVTFGEGGASILRLANGNKLRLSAPPPAITGPSVPRQLVRDAVDVLTSMAAKTQSARTDANLSDQGRRTALADTHAQTVLTTGQLFKAARSFKQSVAEREQRLYAVEPPNLNQAGAAIRAWECRSYYAALSEDQKGAFFASIKQNTGQAAEIVSALLTSPYAVASEEMGALRELWQEARRAQNPTEAEAIDADREAAEWAEATIATIAVPVKELMDSVGAPSPLAFMAKVKMAPDALGYEAFGIEERDLNRARQIEAFEAEPAGAE